MTYYIGNESNGQGDNPRYFYALRRDDDGTLYFTRVDQLTDANAEVIINNPGLAQNDFTEFEYGVDFFDGRLEEDHSRPYSNMHYDQYRWDNQNIYYYLNDNGEFIVRVNKVYSNYPA